MAREVDQFKQGFFDRGAVAGAMSEAARRGMMRTGGYIRTVAKNSMKKKKGPSAPGTPPHVHKGQLKNLLFFAYDALSTSLVVGPVGFKGSDVPRVLEFGGRGILQRGYMRPAQAAAIERFAESVKFGS